MISEQDKQAILNGAYGVTKNGTKVKYIGEIAGEPVFCSYNKNGSIETVPIFFKPDFTIPEYEGEYDIVGLWEDKPEPFDLERALAGEPVMLRNGMKAYILKQIKDTLIGYFDECSPFSWDINGDASLAAESNHDIISMWKDPQPVSRTVTLTIPCPLKDPIGYKWYVNSELDTPKCKNTDAYTKTFISKGCYFDTKEDAQAWLDAMRNNRR